MEMANNGSLLGYGVNQRFYREHWSKERKSGGVGGGGSFHVR